MKIARSQLRRLIKEELSRIYETADTDADGDVDLDDLKADVQSMSSTISSIQGDAGWQPSESLIKHRNRKSDLTPKQIDDILRIELSIDLEDLFRDAYILETDPSQGPEEVFSDVDAMDILAGSGPESPGKWIWKFAKKDRWTDEDAELKYLNLSEYERHEYVKYLDDNYGSYFYGT